MGGKEMIEFDLELAKKGFPVCTRKGCPVRILCFDAKHDAPIVGLVDNSLYGHDDYLEQWYEDGKSYSDKKIRDIDLMMCTFDQKALVEERMRGREEAYKMALEWISVYDGEDREAFIKHMKTIIS